MKIHSKLTSLAEIVAENPDWRFNIPIYQRLYVWGEDQVLTLLYSEPDEATPIEDLCSWVEAPRIDHFRTRVIQPMHKDRLVEYDRDSETVLLLPPGVSAAETLLGG